MLQEDITSHNRELRQRTQLAQDLDTAIVDTAWKIDELGPVFEKRRAEVIEHKHKLLQDATQKTIFAKIK